MTRFHGLVPWLQPYADYLYLVAEYNGLRPRITSVYRSYQQQAHLYDLYRRGLSQLPAAPPGRSKHQYGLAFDMVTDNAPALGAFWTGMGGQFGGTKDPVHFEAP